MVTPSLKAYFESRGVGLIPLEQGAEAFVDALADGDAAIERIIGCGDLVGGRTLRGHLAIDPVRLPPLDDHRIDGAVVVPVALMIEWIGRWASALGFTDGWSLSRVQVLRGMTMAEGDATLEFVAEPASDGVDFVVYDVAGHKRYAASMQPGRPPSVSTAPGLISGEKLSAEAAARQLFHGPRFLAIQSVDGLDDRGAEARLSVMADRDWPPQRWLTDPVLVDGALQLAVIWGRKRLDKVTLPMRVERFVQRDIPEGAPMHGTLSVTARSEHHFVCDVVVSSEGRVVAELGGVQMYATTRSGS